MLVRRLTIGMLGAALLLSHTIPARAAADGVDIPVILSLTGSAAFLGNGYADTLRMLEAEVNRTGGIQGRPLHFSIGDDQTNPQVAIQLARSATEKNPSVLIEGGPLSQCRAVAPIVVQGPVMLCLSPSIRPDAGSFVYSIWISTRDGLEVSFRYLRERGVRRIAILSGTDATGQDADDLVRSIVAEPANVRAGVSLSAFEHFNLTDISVAAQIAHIKSSGAQAVIAYTTGAPIATVLRGLADAGVDVPVITSPGNMSVPQMTGYKAFMPKEMLFVGLPVGSPDNVGDAGVRARIRAFLTVLQRAGMQADLLHELPWDPGMLLVEALRHRGPQATAEQIRTELATVHNWPGIAGRYDFEKFPQRGLGADWGVVSRWDPTRESFVASSSPGGAPLKR